MNQAKDILDETTKYREIQTTLQARRMMVYDKLVDVKSSIEDLWKNLDVIRADVKAVF